MRPLYDVFHMLQYEKGLADIDSEEAELEKLKQQHQQNVKKNY